LSKWVDWDLPKLATTQVLRDGSNLKRQRPYWYAEVPCRMSQCILALSQVVKIRNLLEQNLWGEVFKDSAERIGVALPIFRVDGAK
jgi:hypothetical protein